jgi:hypothetical protein
MTRNVTLRLDDAVLRKARHIAVEHDQSLSQWVSSLICRTVSQDETFKSARRRALRRLGKGYRLGGRPLSRQEIHER